MADSDSLAGRLDQRTPEQIKEDILGRMAGAAAGLDTREGGFLSDMVGPLAMELWKDKQSRRAMEDMFYVTADSGEYLDKAAAVFGLVRKPGAKARALLEFTGQDGVVVPAGKVFLAGALEFATLEQTVLAEGRGQALAEALLPGRQYNVEAGAIGQQYENLPGLTAVISQAATGGIDQETDQALYSRYRDALQNPATSGNIAHYRQWALEVDGVGHAAVIPQMEGPGTVGVILADPEGKPATQQTAEACAKHIEERRPVGASVLVRPAQAVTVELAASLQLETPTTLERVRQALEEELTQYFAQAPFSRRRLAYHRAAAMLLGIPGVVDYRRLTLCGAEADLEIGETQAPVLGEVELTLAD